MAIQLGSPPPNIYDLVAQGISRVSGNDGAGARIANVEDPSKLNAALPHKVYTLGATDLVRGSNLNQARLVAWRVLIQYGKETIAAAELNCDLLGNNLKFAGIDIGPFAKKTHDLVEALETSDVVHRGSYELRALRASSVYVMALWLKNLSGGEDIVLQIPSAPGPAKLGIGGAMPLGSTDFVNSLRGKAADTLRFDNRPQSDGGGGNAPGGTTPGGGRRPGR